MSYLCSDQMCVTRLSSYVNFSSRSRSKLSVCKRQRIIAAEENEDKLDYTFYPMSFAVSD